MTTLNGIIRDEIQAQGPMRFDRFMELALYHPGFGYYSKAEGTPTIGRGGDFFTSVNVGPLFGRLLGRQFLQMWQMLGRPSPFWMVEQGAHDGQLACDILEWCREEEPAFFEAIRYAIVQPTHGARLRCEKEPLARVTWLENLEALGAQQPVGVFFSNELVDAFPVRVIACRSGQWLERHVENGADNGFVWVEQPMEDVELTQAVRELLLATTEGYVTEVSLRARAWMDEVGRAMKQGYVVTIDYGYPASVYYAPFRIAGTLTAYRRHHRSGDVLSEPGMRDITAHVDFSALARAGEKAGLATLGFVDQQRFLTGIAHDEMSGAGGPRLKIQEDLRAWMTLTHPGHLGASFQVLVQAKNAPAQLDGLRFARPGGLD